MNKALSLTVRPRETQPTVSPQTRFLMFSSNTAFAFSRFLLGEEGMASAQPITGAAPVWVSAFSSTGKVVKVFPVR